MNHLDTKHLVAFLDRLCVDRLTASTDYEAKNSYEMAYLARWSVIEGVIKEWAAIEQLDQFRPDLLAWHNYVSDTSLKRPAPIKRFPIDPARAKLPTIAELKGKLNATHLLEVLDPDKKYRRKRNNIAHFAESFSKPATYEEYRAKLDAALAELRKFLKIPPI